MEGVRILDCGHRLTRINTVLFNRGERREFGHEKAQKFRPGMRSRQIFLVKRALSKDLSSTAKSTSLPSGKMPLLAERNFKDADLRRLALILFNRSPRDSLRRERKDRSTEIKPDTIN